MKTYCVVSGLTHLDVRLGFSKQEYGYRWCEFLLEIQPLAHLTLRGFWVSFIFYHANRAYSLKVVCKFEFISRYLRVAPRSSQNTIKSSHYSTTETLRHFAVEFFD